MATPDFSELALKQALASNLESIGYTRMTPIQALSLGPILDGQDVIGQAMTGSGKTAAFGLGLLQALTVKRFRIQSLVLCPTRELADQVAKEIRRLGRAIHNIKVLTLCGGVPFGPQKGSLEHGAHIIVGTPGRIEEHLRKGNLRVNEISMLVLDEADRMLDMGFTEVIEQIVGKLPTERQTLLFSATFPEDIESLAMRVTNNPSRVTADEQHDAGSIRQLVYEIPSKDARLTMLIDVLLFHQPVSTLVFCNTRQMTEEVASGLISRGFAAMALHGEFAQKDRDSRLLRFANGSTSVLVATDVASRGLDIESLDLVVNYHLPRDPEVYTHRIGRTGRAGSQGIACSLCLPQDRHRVEQLTDLTAQTIEHMERPVGMDRRQPLDPQWVTLQIDGGRKQKIRPGDLLGALTREGGIEGDQVGRINILDLTAYVAVDRSVSRTALNVLQKNKIKGRSFKTRRVNNTA